MDRDEDVTGRHERAGVCATCCFARVLESAKGNEFWRCLRADEDDAFLKYPPLPVTSCAGFEAR